MSDATRITSQYDGSAATVPERNVMAVARLEREELNRRSLLDRLTDRVSAGVSSKSFVALHLIWFTLWIGINVRVAHPIDTYPFNLLTMIVSLEAIVLTSLVLMAQDRLTKLADKRAHLDLQVNLIAEQELTAILRVVCRIADQAGIDVQTCDPTIRQWLGETDVHTLARELDRELKASDAEHARTDPD